MHLENVKLIEALPDLVWRATQGIGKWSCWTPTVTSVIRLDDGPIGVGCLAGIKQPGMPGCEWRVTDLREGAGFTWETHDRVHRGI
jgi:hypothetical protein